ncbi:MULTISPECIES: hypothetical protein [Bacillaceae]|uniref:Transposase n=1 Tax=Ectobacillus funiculus TaxID=137993 RepID=A0ABV5WL76_9BACI
MSFTRERKNVKDHGTYGFRFQETLPNDVATVIDFNVCFNT